MKIQDPNRIILAKKKEEDIRLMLDIDGVVANWIQSACKICDVDCNDEEIRKKLKKDSGLLDNFVDDSKMWKLIDKKGSKFWSNLELFSWSKELYKRLKKKSKMVSFLSCPPRNPEGGAGKMEWISKNFDTRNFILTPHKEFCATSNSLLIDDMPKKIDIFRKFGGHAFQWPNSFSLLDGDVSIEDTFKELENYIDELK